MRALLGLQAILLAPISHMLPDAERGGDPEVVRESQRRRFADVGLVDRVLALDAEWRDGEAVGDAMAQGKARRRV